MKLFCTESSKSRIPPERNLISVEFEWHLEYKFEMNCLFQQANR